MIILCVLILAVFMLILTDKVKNDILELVSLLIGAVSVIILVLMVCASIIVHIPIVKESAFIDYQQQYDTLIYTVENSPNSLISLTSEIATYNTEILKGRMYMDNIWLSPLCYDFYYDLDLIKLEMK